MKLHIFTSFPLCDNINFNTFLCISVSDTWKRSTNIEEPNSVSHAYPGLDPTFEGVFSELKAILGFGSSLSAHLGTVS